MARAVGEKKTRATRRLREFWDAFVTFEQSHGSLDAMRAAERRRHEALGEPGGGPHSAAAVVAALMSRHTFMGLRPTTLAHSQHFARHGAAVPKQEPTPRAPQYVGEREKRAAAAAAVKPAKAPPKPPTPPAPPPPAKDAAAAKDIPQLPRAPPGLETFRRWRRRRRLLGRGRLRIFRANSARSRRDCRTRGAWARVLRTSSTL